MRILKSSLFCYCDHEKTVNLSGVQQNIQVIYFNVWYEAEEIVMTHIEKICFFLLCERLEK